MSRLTKFLRQECLFEKAQRDAVGKVELNAYGDILYEEAQTVKCRRERFVRDIQTSTGSTLKTSSRYFLDETHPVEADDRIDGKVILSVEEYTNQLGRCEGFECYV